MYIPIDHTLWSTDPFHSNGSTNPTIEKWSSLIGIVTAICGNILISFALNTQRYAHLRLARDREESGEKRRWSQRAEQRSYGTQEEQQRVIAEQRARVNRRAEREQYGVDEDPDETAPLIPSVESLESNKTDTHSADDSDAAYDEDGQDEDDSEDGKEKSYLRSPIWWVGIAMMTVGEAGNFLAYGFAPASIVSPLGVVALISNCLIAPLLLHERFRWRDGVGVLVAVAGCVTVVFSASDSNPKLSPDSIWHLITRWEFETYLGVTVFLIILLSIASNKYGHRTIVIDIGLVGLYGGYTALSTKGVASLLSNTIWRVVTFPITYLLVAVLVGSAVMQIKYVNRALQRFNSTMVIPTQFVMFTLSVIVGSAVLYRDFERTTTEQAVKFVGGCALTFSGVYLITSGRNDNQEDEDEEPREGEEGINLLDEERTQYEVRERDDGGGRRQSMIAGPSKKPPGMRLFTPRSPSQSGKQTSPVKSPDLTPAETAMIHEESAGNLAPRGPHQLMHATTSAPEIPTQASLPPSTSLRPKTPKRASNSAVESPSKAPPATPQPRRPPPDQNGSYLDPNTSHKLLNRHSMAGLVPGPLTSPLSSSLSAIVADSLRRGSVSGGMSRRKSMQRRSTGKRDPNATPLKRHSIASGEMDFPDREGDAEQGRMRSMSATLDEVFGPATGVGKAGKDPATSRGTTAQ